MLDKKQFYINGAWVAPHGDKTLEVINPADETPFAAIALGDSDDADAAVAAAKAAFPSWSNTDKAERLALLRRIAEIYESRTEDMAQTISQEMGAPINLARRAQAAVGVAHIHAFITTLEAFEFDQRRKGGASNEALLYEPVGVCALITPWNWPMNQVTLKVIAAIAAGATCVLKPSEIAPLNAMLFFEFLHEAGVPAGVVNLVNGDGPGVGEGLASHPDVDMVSLTGSTRAGISVMKSAADGVKRVALELGGKSPNLIFADSDVQAAVKYGAQQCFMNTGQSCNAPTRMLVEESVYEEAIDIAADMARNTKVGPPSEEGDHIGPLVSEQQFNRVQHLIEEGIKEGARLVEGGPGRPEGVNRGYFARPTIFADVRNDMTIAQEEIFGPVMSIIPFKDEDQAVEIANDTPYGLAAYLNTSDEDRLKRIGRKLRAGMLQLNRSGRVPGAPFGGYKMSGIGREGGLFGMEEFLEVKSVFGWPWDEA